MFWALTRLRVAVGGVSVALARLTPRAAEVEESRVAVITLGAVYAGLTHTRPCAARGDRGHCYYTHTHIYYY